MPSGGYKRNGPLSPQEKKRLILGGQIGDQIRKKRESHHINVELPLAENKFEQELSKVTDKIVKPKEGIEQKEAEINPILKAYKFVIKVLQKIISPE